MRAVIRLSGDARDTRVAPRAFEIASCMFSEDRRFFGECYEVALEEHKHLVPTAKVTVRFGNRVVLTKEEAR